MARIACLRATLSRNSPERTTFVQEKLNPADYPRTYRMSPRWMIFMLVFGLAALTGGAWGIWYFQLPGHARDPISALVLRAFMLFVAGFGSYVVLSAVKSRVVLYPDRLAVYDVLKTRTLERDQIRGRRFLDTQNSPGMFVLVPREGRPKIKIARVYVMDPPFVRWMESLPDLDSQDRKAAEQEILGPEASPARQEREEALMRARRLCRLLFVLTYGALLWGWIDPKPYGLVITLLALLPWIGLRIVARSQGVVRLDAPRNDPHPNVAAAFIVPGLTLWLRAMLDFKLLSWKLSAFFTIAFALALLLAAVAADSSLRQKKIAVSFMALFALSYGFGLSTEANCLLDHSPADVYRTMILSKRISNGTKSTTFYLTLAPWGSRQDADNVRVSRSFYHSVQRGDSICVNARPGALRIPWYAVSNCQ